MVSIKRFLTRHPRGKILLAIFLLWLSTCQTPAYADGQAVSDILSPFDLTDSKGVRISQFALNINMGNAVTSTWKLMLTPILIGAWSLYSWWVGFVGWALDFTLGLEWATYITAAFNHAGSALRANLLVPMGAGTYGGGVVKLLLVIAAIGVALTYHRRGTGSAIAEALWSSLAAALAIGTLLLPVALFAGGETLATPLTYARGLSVEAMAAVHGVEAPKADDGKLPDNLKPSVILIDSFVRLPHQAYNYGSVIDGTKCEETYTNALKAGPVEASSDKTRSLVGKCDKKYKTYADNADFWWLFVQSMFGLTGLTLSLTVFVLLILMWFSIMSLCWSSLKTTYSALMAIVSSSSWSGLVRDFCNIAVSLLEVITAPFVLSIGLRMIKVVFAAQGVTLAHRFLIADLALVITIGLLIANKVGNKNWGKKLAAKIAAKTPAGTAKQSNSLVKAAGLAYAGRQVMNAYQNHQQSVPRPTMSIRPTATQAVQRVATSKGLALAAGAATGGTGTVAIKGTQTLMKAANVYSNIRQGKPTTGLATNALVPLARAHNSVATAKKKAHDAMLDKVETSRAIFAQGQTLVGRHGERMTTGNLHRDRVIADAGYDWNRTVDALRTGQQVATQARRPTRRGTPATTGNSRLDAVLNGVGRTQRSADHLHEWATRERRVEPVMDGRVGAAVVRRDAAGDTRRGALRPDGGAAAPRNPGSVRVPRERGAA